MLVIPGFTGKDTCDGITRRELLRVGQLQRSSRLKRAALSIRKRNESGFRNVDRVTPCWQLREFVRAVSISLCAAAAGDFRGVDQYSRARNRPSGVGGEDSAGNSTLRRWCGHGGRLLGGGVARRLLLAALLCLGGDDDDCEDRERAKTEHDLLPAERQSWPQHVRQTFYCEGLSRHGPRSRHGEGLRSKV